jgi:hypothetical protein
MSPSAATAGGLLLDISGAIILALGLVMKTPELALEESTPRWDFNAVLDGSLAAQTADAQVGAGLLVLGFGVQMAAALGWRESSWLATGLALGAAALVATAAWMFLRYFWRPRKITQVLFVRLRSLNMASWWPALFAFGGLLNRPWFGESELIADYAIRLIGRTRWESLTAGVDPTHLIPYTRPRPQIPGTSEYRASHRGPAAP